MPYGKLIFNAWVGIHDGCDMTYKVNGGDGVCVTVNDKTQPPLEFFFAADALRQFVALCGAALAEMDAQSTADVPHSERRVLMTP